MINRNILKTCFVVATLFTVSSVSAHTDLLRTSKVEPATSILVADNTRMAKPATKKQYTQTNRPAPEDRLFTSTAVEKEIARIQGVLTNPKLAWMFGNCFPNTLDTTIHYRKDDNGKDDTFVYTGDIHAMWLRDSGAQVYPYVQLANSDAHLKQMLWGVIMRQFKCINIDPYANAFNDGPVGGDWMSDATDMKLDLHERKWEIDSLCYPIRLAYQYWLTTGDASIFGDEWLSAIKNILKTFREQQRKQGVGPYSFLRVTDRSFDTLSNAGLGTPVNPVGLIVSAFRPSDDATTLQFLVPSNFFAVTSLRKAAEILTKVNKQTELAAECTALATEVETALQTYAVYNHPKYGKIYAFEVDGFGNHLLMDDANVPSLLAMPYLGDMAVNDPIYQNTRRFVWSEDNPYFFRGTAGEGIGGPHIGYDMIWPMSLMMKAFTSQNDDEIKACVKMVMDTEAGTGFIHESFHKNDPAKFTRVWFAWQNTLFGELILKLVNEGKVDLLNSIE
ncbi:MAG: glycoside hydrolase family 125 protein [Alistipes sp.]